MVYKAVTTDMDTWSAFAVGPHTLFCKNCTFLGGIWSQKAPFDRPNFFKGGRDINPCRGLSSAKIALFWGVFGVRRHHLTAQIFLKVGETSTHVQFLLGFWLIYNVVILPPDQNNHSQSTGVKEIFKNPTCCQISWW